MYRAFESFLRSPSLATKRSFRQLQRKVKRAVDEARESWIAKVAADGEAAVKDGKTRWESIRKLQRAFGGRKSVRPSAVKKLNGELAEGEAEVLQRWQQHFATLLNVQSSVDEEVLDAMPIHAQFCEFDDLPTEEELEEAIFKMKKGKAAGKSGILPELLLYGGGALWLRLLELIQDMWNQGRVVSDWKDALIVPIPKKGDLQQCDNWRGISLLDVAGKVFARVIQERLSLIAERLLPDSQCGFRKGRGCVDMVFVARQLLEKAREHNDYLYTLFVDLRKAYDSVPRSALWRVLEKCGVPPKLLTIARSFHQDMHAEVRLGGSISSSFEVNNGLRQGCTMAPTLFNLFFSAVVNSWRSRCQVAGVEALFKIGRRLVGDRTAKSKLDAVKVTESQFADDVALYATSRASFEAIAVSIVEESKRWGMTVSLAKTKGILDLE